MILVGVHDYHDGLHDDCTVITDNKICSSINTISRPGNSEEQAHSGLENDHSSDQVRDKMSERCSSKISDVL